MKKFLLPFAAISALFMGSCSEKFNVAAPYKEMTVVYGFLDMSDTAHYVRIQKAFLDENKSALTMATESDSNFFTDLSVRVERYTVGTSPRLIDSISLSKVNLDNEGYPKQPGIFFTAPNYAYKFTGALNPLYNYRLKITHLTSGAIDSVDAQVIDTNRKVFGVPSIDDNTSTMSFYSVLTGRTYTVDGSYTIPSNLATSPVAMGQAYIRFNWVDSNIVAKTTARKYVDYDAGYIGISTTNFDFKVDNLSLYSALSNGMGDAPANTIRLLDRCDISVYVTTSDYSDYLAALSIQGNGLTGSEIAPIYTNVKGENVLGFYTSRAMRTGKVTISEKTIDSLVASPLLTHTNLKGTIY